MKAEKCPGIEGIKQEHDEFVKEQSPSPERFSPAPAHEPSITRGFRRWR